MSSQPRHPGPRPAKSLPKDAKVLDTTGTTRNNVCQAARVAAGSGWPGPVRMLLIAFRFSRNRSAEPRMTALCRASAARKSLVRARVNSLSAQGADSSRGSLRSGLVVMPKSGT
jgi:hypothetical protein